MFISLVYMHICQGSPRAGLPLLQQWLQKGWPAAQVCPATFELASLSCSICLAGKLACSPILPCHVAAGLYCRLCVTTDLGDCSTPACHPWAGLTWLQLA